ncbi:MAG: S8 family serine peptidase [Micromonosporaceae bacterium]
MTAAAAGRWAAAVLCGLAVSAGPSVPGYAAGDPPPLPYGGDECVGESDVTYDGVPWPVARMAPHLAWPVSRGDGVTVAVVDSGVGKPPGLEGAVQRGRDVVSGGRADDDCAGRGTALAGIVAARPVGRRGVVGIAPEASVLPIRIIDGDGQVPPKAIAKGIQAATKLGADVILVGTAAETDDAGLRGAVAKAVADDVLVVAPVAERDQGPGFPAGYEQVLSVGGVDPDGQPTETHQPDLYAPGYGIVAVGGAGHYEVSGPSVAAGYVAGAAALVRAYHPDLDEAEVRERLTLTAMRTGAEDPGAVDPPAAVSDLDPGRTNRTPEPRGGALTLPDGPGSDPAVPRSLWYGGSVLLATLTVLAVVAVLRSRRRAAG